MTRLVAEQLQELGEPARYVPRPASSDPTEPLRASMQASIEFDDGPTLHITPRKRDWKHEQLRITGLYPAGHEPFDHEKQGYTDRINCSTHHRGPSDIARDIQRRLLPGYRYLYGISRSRVESAERYGRWTEQVMERLRKAAPKGLLKPQRFGIDRQPFLTFAMDRSGLSGQIRAAGTGRLQLEVTGLSEEHLRALLEAIKEHPPAR
jgi:hypothetical protein